MRYFITSFLIFCSLLTASAQEYRHEKNIAYRDTLDDGYIGQMCRLDVVSPKDAKQLPVVVWFHGGGLTSGNRYIPEVLKKNGVIVVGVGYRFSPRVSTDNIIDDAAAAVAWVFDNAERLGGDPSKIYVAGHSAGGYLVSMIGLDRTRLAKYGKNADLLAGIIPFSGQAITHFETRRNMNMTALQPLIDKSAPLYHVRKDAAPILIISGDREMELFGRYEESAYFYRMLKINGHPDVTIYELDGYDHGAMCEPAFQLLVNFIRQHDKVKL